MGRAEGGKDKGPDAPYQVRECVTVDCMRKRPLAVLFNLYLNTVSDELRESKMGLSKSIYQLPLLVLPVEYKSRS